MIRETKRLGEMVHKLKLSKLQAEGHQTNMINENKQLKEKCTFAQNQMYQVEA